jgi:predicted Fe-S protein YdhL (DUF1289 family)
LLKNITLSVTEDIVNDQFLYKESKMNNIESPCVGKCCLDEKDICLGCSRSLEEIKEWGGASNQRKEQILIRIELLNN